MGKIVKDLEPKYDSRASFYGKARTEDDGIKLTLISYATEVAYIKRNEIVVLGVWGTTTTRHIREFLRQNGFDYRGSAKELYKNYGVKK